MSMAPRVPEMGTDAAGADTYADVINGIARECNSISVYCATHPAIISMDDGTTDNLFVAAGVQFVFHGLVIPKGAVIQAKNGTAGSNYATLSVAVWQEFNMSMKPRLLQSGSDATGQDAYAAIINGTTSECHSLYVNCSTKSVAISLDGGTTTHYCNCKNDIPLIFNGLVIPKGSVISELLNH